MYTDKKRERKLHCKHIINIMYTKHVLKDLDLTQKFQTILNNTVNLLHQNIMHYELVNKVVKLSTEFHICELNNKLPLYIQLD